MTDSILATILTSPARFSSLPDLIRASKITIMVAAQRTESTRPLPEPSQRTTRYCFKVAASKCEWHDDDIHENELERYLTVNQTFRISNSVS